MNLLNVGCGETYHPDWLNIDLYGDGINVENVNILEGLPYESNYFDCLYSSHVLEHFEKSDGLKLLGEMYRVLKPGGIIRVVVPDLEGIMREYLKRLDDVLDNESEENDFKYEWMYLELYDQTTRTYSGGEMAKRINNESKYSDFSFSRIGFEMFGNNEKKIIPYLSDLKKENDIYIFGASEFGQKLNKMLKVNNIFIKGFIDNSLNLQGNYVDNHLVHGLDSIEKDVCIIVASTWWNEIEQQLLSKSFENIKVLKIRNNTFLSTNDNLEQVKEIIEAKLDTNYMKFFNEGVFRNQGEIHRQMYDRYSLMKVLRQTGFKVISKKSAFESDIPKFSEYQLDTINKYIRKPDSLFMEAIK